MMCCRIWQPFHDQVCNGHFYLFHVFREGLFRWELIQKVHLAVVSPECNSVLSNAVKLLSLHTRCPNCALEPESMAILVHLQHPHRHFSPHYQNRRGISLRKSGTCNESTWRPKYCMSYVVYIVPTTSNIRVTFPQGSGMFAKGRTQITRELSIWRDVSHPCFWSKLTHLTMLKQ